ncbi:cadherin-like beta sandwich domain-containing protein [Geofilum rubicundum]|nr:cadherin-like beta sandwich domain-containing protein [Geofilum rubicundum]
MKRKNLLFKFWMIMVIMGLSGSVITMAQTLKHSYTFEDGTAADAIGGADGVLHEDAVVENGALVLSGTGFATLPAKVIDIPSYESVTVEAFFTQSAGLTGNTTLFSFGRMDTETDWKGLDYYFFQPTRGDGNSRTAISTGNIDNPWATETGVNRPAITDTRTHHVVSVLTATEIRLYFDGELIGTELLTGSNAISAISSDTALIGMLVYQNDPKWQGSVEELNIFEGVMTEAELDQRFKDFMGDAYFDPRLETLSVNKGVLSPEFNSEELFYDLFVPYGTTSVVLEASTVVGGANMAIFDGLNNEIPESGEVVFGLDGIEVSIEVTALDGSTSAIYYVSISQDPAEESARLSGIDLSVGELTMAFDPDSTNYTVIAPQGTTSVDVTGVPMWEGATVSGDGTVTLTDGVGSTTISVISEDGLNSMAYTVDIYETAVTTGQFYFIQHEASGYVVGESGADPNLIRIYNPLNDEPSQLFQFEESGVEGQFYIKSQNDRYLTLTSDPVWDMKMVDALTTDLDSCRFELSEFEPGRFRVISVARAETVNKYMGTNNSSVEGGVYSDKYIDNTLAVWNIKAPADVVDPFDTYLSDLSVAGENVKLFPSFNMFETNYFIVLPIGTTSLDITAIPRDATASVSGAGVQAVSGEGSLTITVTATDPQYFREYVINYLEDSPLTLNHSYTFADGTAKDVVGDAHGTLNGGLIEDGVYVAGTEGDYISFPGDKIAINTYPSVTMEVYFVAGDGVNGNNTMITWLGNTSADNFGVDGVFMSHKSRAAISCGSYSAPWGAEDGVNSILLEDGLPHHMVATLNNDSIALFVDGTFIGSAQLRDANKVFNLSNELAYLCKGGYAGDETWNGSVLEYNIYAGIMDQETVAQRSTAFPIEDGSEDATLLDLMLDGVSLEGFSSSVLDYTVEVADESYEPFISAEAKNAGANITIVQAPQVPGTATVEVVAADGVTSYTYTIEFVMTSTSIDEAKEETVIVYPTITNGAFTIKTKGQAGMVTVYDMTGRVVVSQPLQSSEDTISLPKAGMYILKVDTQDEVKVFKVIKRD